MIHPTKTLLAIIGVPISALSAWLCAAVAKYGVHLDQSGINALGVTGATAAAAIVVKLIHDVETHHPALERLLMSPGLQINPDAPNTPPGTHKTDPSLATELKGWIPEPTG